MNELKAPARIAVRPRTIHLTEQDQRAREDYLDTHYDDVIDGTPESQVDTSADLRRGFTTVFNACWWCHKPLAECHCNPPSAA